MVLLRYPSWKVIFGDPELQQLLEARKDGVDDQHKYLEWSEMGDG